MAAWMINNPSISSTENAAKEQASIQSAHITLIVHFIGAVLCLLGALQMWKLKKKGFYFFSVGVIVPDIVSGSVFGASIFSGVMFAVFIIPVLFIVFYGLHLKHMS